MWPELLMIKALLPDIFERKIKSGRPYDRHFNRPQISALGDQPGQLLGQKAR
jgi:hypothetical protein